MDKNTVLPLKRQFTFYTIHPVFMPLATPLDLLLTPTITIICPEQTCSRLSRLQAWAFAIQPHRESLRKYTKIAMLSIQFSLSLVSHYHMPSCGYVCVFYDVRSWFLSSDANS